MACQILLTSFDTWRPDQRSNASDDLLASLLTTEPIAGLHLLRRLPVDLHLALQQTIAQLQTVQPAVVVCCGMAERRDRLHLEQQAQIGDRILQTRLDVVRLGADLRITDISQDAGQFVCNQLYFALLEFLQPTDCHPLFVHVPPLTASNQLLVLADFRQILKRLQQMLVEQGDRS